MASEEEKFRETILMQLKELKFPHNIDVGTERPVLKDVTVQKIKKGFQLSFDFFSQDIVIFLKNEKLPKVDQYNYHQLGKKEFIIPLIIFEVKIGKNLTSHVIITYSQIALEIKDKFPWVKYNLVLNNRGEKQPNTLARHGKHFDKIFVMGQDSYKDLQNAVLLQLEEIKKLGVF